MNAESPQKRPSKADAPRRYTVALVAAYRAGHAAADSEFRKPFTPPRNGGEVRRQELQRIIDGTTPPAPGSVQSSFKGYRGELARGAFVMGWVDAMNGRDAEPKAGDNVVAPPQMSPF